MAFDVRGKAGLINGPIDSHDRQRPREVQQATARQSVLQARVSERAAPTIPGADENDVRPNRQGVGILRRRCVDPTVLLQPACVAAP